ncbi:MAG: carbohydrate kinase [Candidatus Latescibacteria bacterium]|nr:carbohydrate kinase [Candidatus Latescibacterota bacterium]
MTNIQESPLLIGIGAVLWDVFPDGARLGGAPANFAVHAAALGTRSALVSCVGDDARGREATELLKGHGVITDAVQVDAHRPTGTVPVTLVNGQPSYEIVEGVAWDAIGWRSELASLAHSAHAICFGTLDQREITRRQTILRFLDAASPACLRVLDVNFRQHYHCRNVVQASLERADVLKLSDEEVPLLREYVDGSGGVDGFWADVLTRYELRCVILTLGEKGCRVVSAECVFEVQGEKQAVVNTVGAGDAFTAAFISHLINGADLQLCAEQANLAGGFVTTQDSGMPKLPPSFRVFNKR